MEEELNENELEERLYAMLHHVDETQANLTITENETVKIVDITPQSTIRRYWRTSDEQNLPNIHEKVNPQKVNNTPPKPLATNDQKPKEEKCDSNNSSSVDLSIFKNPPNIIKSTIEILHHDLHNPVVLESSDEDEVVEVKLPPKPTITIESSDEDELHIITNSESPTKEQDKNLQYKSASNGDRESASPVPSVVSSVSDEFIRGDCIALNISSRRPHDHSFDFSLHGSDLLGQESSKKKKKKRSKESVSTSTPVTVLDKSKRDQSDECFATPKSKAKHKNQKKLYTVTEKSVPNIDVYDSDSNQSVTNVKTNENSFIVSEKSLPNADVYESDSNQSDIVKENEQPNNNVVKDSTTSDSNVTLEKPQVKPQQEPPKTKESSSTPNINKSADVVVDLTDSDDLIMLDTADIPECIVMANVSGFQESSDYSDEPVSKNEIPNYGSTKYPPILYDNLDFDNLKGTNKISKRRKYSLTTLRAEMQKFYNESWGGEDFNHREIQKHMSKDKSLWMIDAKDRMPGLANNRKKVTCHYCNRAGHRDDTCRMKPAVCYMCGSTGHFEPRCPSKICVNCGAPNQLYSTMCRNCSFWGRIRCAECGQHGHPASHCPDTWRRYHNTVDVNLPLEENRQTKKSYHMYCSGCTRRGHLVHTCRFSIPFSSLPINSPYVSEYRPLYLPTSTDNSKHDNNQKNKQSHKTAQDSTISLPTNTCRSDRNKRQSKSPSSQETVSKKKKQNSLSESLEPSSINKNNIGNRGSRKNSQGKETVDNSDKAVTNPPGVTIEKAPDYIPIFSSNRDKKGQIIQDNEVSDTSDIITSARIYITQKVKEELKTKDGQEWLDKALIKCNITIESSDMNLFLNIKGKIADQEAFQAELRDWTTYKENPKTDDTNLILSLIPKYRNKAIGVISKALESLKSYLGDPTTLYKELTYLQSRQEQLLRQKEISHEQVSNNRNNIKYMLKKLNMVLLGQAGLANGTQHVNELMYIKEKLTKSNQKTVPLDMRKEIGQHYHCIFTAAERSDYSQLLQKYFDLTNNKTNSMAKKRNKSQFKVKHKIMENTVKSNSNFFYNKAADKSNNEEQVTVPAADTVNEKIRTSPQNTSVQDLVTYHRKILKAKPNNSYLKKMKSLILRKLHSHIVSMHNNGHKISTKNIRKFNKTKLEAITFLENF